MLKLEERKRVNPSFRQVKLTAPPRLGDRLQDLVQIFALFLIECLSFVPLTKKIGFYLDDWATFSNLHFAKPDFFSLLQASLSDPRMITRPTQCLYYAITYMFFQNEPYGYHLVRCFFEFCGAAFLYLGLVRVSQSRLLAGIASVLFLLYPTHDASHYWIGAGLGAGFGLTLYLLSFYLLAKNAEKGRAFDYCFSLIAFAFSAYCYEAFLPLLALSFFGVFKILCRSIDTVSAFKQALLRLLPFLLIGLSEPVYQRLLVPAFTHVFLSPSHFDLSYFAAVFFQGFNVSLGPEAIAFLAARAGDGLQTDWSSTKLLYLTLIGLLSAVSLNSCLKEKNTKLDAGFLFFLGFGTIVASYLTFAVAEGYMPTLWSMISRVNAGASVGASILIASAITWLILKARDYGKNMAVLAFLLLNLPLVAGFTLSDWGLSGHWMRSWQVQKHVQTLIAGHKEQIKADDSILLLNCPRYVMWAPVFDGVWDFQEMLRITLNRKSASAGVVSERFEVTKSGIKDRSCGFLCAVYPYDSLKLLIPGSDEWIPVANARDFIHAVEAKGMGFGLSPATVSGWKEKTAGD